MGFPNLDVYFVEKFISQFQYAQRNINLVVNDLFSDLHPANRTEIVTYITRKKFQRDVRDRGGKEDSSVYIFHHYPMLDMPFPQISVALSGEETVDRFLNDVVGEATPEYADDGVTQIAWNIPKGYWAHATYTADIVATTHDEAIWLSRFIQRFICEEYETLDTMGVKECMVSLNDTKLDQVQLPMTVFSRRVTLSCKVANTWTKRVPIYTLETGINTAIGYSDLI